MVGRYLAGDNAKTAARKLRYARNGERVEVAGITFVRNGERVEVRSARERATTRIITAPADVAAVVGITKRTLDD